MRTPPAACADCRELIGGFVLDALDPDETEAVARHIEVCADCAAEHDRLELIPDLLDLAGAAEPAYERPPAQLEDAILDSFAREHPQEHSPRRGGVRRRLAALGRQLRRPLPAAAAGALAAAAIAAAIVIPGGGEGQYATARGDLYRAELSGLGPAPRARATASLQTVSSGTRVWLRVDGLKGRPEDLYELWCVRDDGTKISAGTFRVDPRGQAIVQMTTAAVPGEYHHMSVERRSLAPGAGRPVMAGEIHYSSS